MKIRICVIVPSNRGLGLRESVKIYPAISTLLELFLVVYPPLQKA
jgi:hypothetical protein